MELAIGPEPSDLYDAATGRFLRRAASGQARFPLPGDRAAIVVVAPANGQATREGEKLRIEGVAVDYAASRHEEPTINE